MVPYLWALLAFAAALGVRLGLEPLLGERLPFATFVIALTVVTWTWGTRPGSVVLVLGAIAGLAIAVAPRDPPPPDDFGVYASALFAYVFASITIVVAFAQLRRSERRFRGVVESNVLGLVLTDRRTGRVRDANDAFRRLLGAATDAAGDGRVGPTALARRSGLPLDELNARIARDGRAGPWERTIARADGTPVPVVLGGAALDDDTSVVFVLDDSDRRRADERVREHEAYLRTLFDTAPVAIWTAHDRACTRITGNRFAHRLLGFDHAAPGAADTPLGRAPRPFRVLVGGREVPRDELPLQRAAGRGETFMNHEITLAFDDGPPVTLLTSTVPLRDQRGEPAGAIAVCLDISDRKRIEAERAEAYAHAEAVRAEAERRLAETVRLAALNRELVRAIEPRDVHEVVCRWARELVHADGATFALRDGDEIHYVAEDAAVPLWRGRRFPLDRCIAGWAIGRDDVAVVEDVLVDVRMPTEAYRPTGVRSLVGVPVREVGDPRGSTRPTAAVSVVWSRPHRPTPHEIRLLQAVADAAAVALGTAQHFEAANRARREAQTHATILRGVQRVVDATLANLPLAAFVEEVLHRVRDVLGTDTAAMLLAEPRAAADTTADGEDDVTLRAYAAVGLEQEVHAEVRVPVGRGFAGRIAATRAPLVLEAVDYGHVISRYIRERGLRSMAGVPLVSGGRLIGVLHVGSLRTRSFSDADVRLLELAAERVAVALERAAAHEAERHAREVAEAASAAKDEFLAMLAHELRNPLAPIRNAVAVMRRAGDTGQLARARDIVDRQVDHLSRLVDDLLDVSRITRGKIVLRRAPVPVASVVEQALETARPLLEAKGHRLEVRLPAEPLWLDADQARLVQVVGNLLSNAAKFTPDGGRIELAVERHAAGLAIRVRDDGIGIAPEALGRIFDLFAQEDVTLDRQQGGLGIGLTVVKRLVEMHGGRVEARSAGRGHGSEFTITLPVLPPPLPIAPPAPPAVEAREGLRILVVDDHPDAADSLMLFLQHLGHDVHVAYDGDEALARAETAPPDVAIIDIGLPGLDGYEVARRIRANPALGGIRLIALTGYGRDEDRERARAAGFDMHLVKPVDPEALRTMLAKPATPPDVALPVRPSPTIH